MNRLARWMEEEEADPIRFLLDGLDVSSIAELKRLVDLGRDMEDFNRMKKILEAVGRQFDIVTKPIPEHELWRSRLDKRYDVFVMQQTEDGYKGRLVIQDGEEVILDEPVGIQYGAPFGPDVDDIARWECRAAEFVDNLEGSTG